MKRIVSFISVLALLCAMFVMPTSAAALNEALLSHVGGDADG